MVILWTKNWSVTQKHVQSHIWRQARCLKKLNCENVDNLFVMLIALISKWPDISKINPQILVYKMLCVLSYNLWVFDSSYGTTCISYSLGTCTGDCYNCDENSCKQDVNCHWYTSIHTLHNKCYKGKRYRILLSSAPLGQFPLSPIWAETSSIITVSPS